MKRAEVVVPWKTGLHLRPAARLVRLARTFRASILLKCGGKVAHLGSILSVITLCAAPGSIVEIQATGEDEAEALRVVERAFAPEGGPAETPDSRP